MAVLHRKKDGGYYIVGPPLGGANTICTWQITPEGLSYLRGHGIRDEGRVAPQDLQELSVRRLIWTEKTGPGLIDPRSLYDADLLDELVHWTAVGAAHSRIPPGRR